MKLGKDKKFQDLINLIIKYYDWWDKNADTPAETDRAIVAGGDIKKNISFIIFKGDKDDCMKAKDFLERLDKKKANQR